MTSGSKSSEPGKRMSAALPKLTPPSPAHAIEEDEELDHSDDTPTVVGGLVKGLGRWLEGKSFRAPPDDDDDDDDDEEEGELEDREYENKQDEDEKQLPAVVEEVIVKPPRHARTPVQASPAKPEERQASQRPATTSSPRARASERNERVVESSDSTHLSLLQRAELPRAGVPAQYDDGVEWLVAGLRRVTWASVLGVLLGWSGAWLALWGAVAGLIVGAFVGLGVVGNFSISAHLFNLGLGNSVTFLGVLAGAGIGALFGFLAVIRFVFVDNPLAAVLGLIVGYIVTCAIVIVTACFERASLRLRGYRRLSIDEVRKVAPLVKDVADAMDLLALPRFAMVDELIPNAYTAMRTIILTKGLLQTLDDGEIRAILAHELDHWRKGECVSQHFVWAAALPAVLMYKFGVYLQGGIPLGGELGNAGRRLLAIIGWFIAWPSWILVRMVLVPVIRHWQRDLEFEADAAAAEIGLSSQMISALTKLSAFESGRTGWEATLARTHPPTELRIEALRARRPDDWEYHEEDFKMPNWPEIRRIFGGVRRMPRR